MAKLPQGWVECEFSDCIDKISITNKLKQKEYLLEGKYPVIDQGHFFISGYSNDRSLLLEIEQSVIIFGDHTRCFKYVDFSFIAGADGIKVLKPKQFFKSKLFYYFCLALKFPNKGYSRHYQYLEKTIMHIPPLNEQKRIVEKIESEFAKIDEGLEHLLKTKEQIKQYRQSVLKSAFEGKLYKNSEWKSIELKNFCLQVNKRKISNNEQEEFFYIDISSIDNKNNILLSATKYNGKNAPSRARQIVKSGDILFSTVRTYLKNIAMVPSEYDNQIASTGFCVIRTNSNLLYSKFMFYKSLSDNFLEPLNQLQRGSSYPAVRDNDVLSQIVCIPLSIEEQKKIVEEIEKRFAVADEVEKLVEDSIEKGKQLKQSILKKAFEGRLVPQDPTDEPASKLLEKIKQERNIK